LSNQPDKKDIVNLVNSAVGKEVITEETLNRIMQEAKSNFDKRGTEGLFEYFQKVTNAQVDKEQLKGLTDVIKKRGNFNDALDYLKKQNILTNDNIKRINNALDKTKKKKK